jgi:hypothetical protein
MAEERTENTSAAMILVAVVLVLIIGMAFYFGLIRGGGAVGGPDENTIEFNETNLGPGADSPANEGAWVDVDAQ